MEYIQVEIELQLVTGIKKTGASSLLAVFLRFLVCSAKGASGFLRLFSYVWPSKR